MAPPAGILRVLPYAGSNALAESRVDMAQACEVCGKKPVLGNQVTHRGKAKYLGGVGTKVTGISRRKFRPNLQRVHVTTPNGTRKTMRVCTAVHSQRRSDQADPPQPVQVAEDGQSEVGVGCFVGGQTCQPTPGPYWSANADRHIAAIVDSPALGIAGGGGWSRQQVDARNDKHGTKRKRPD